MSKIKQADGRANFPQMEDRVNEFWKLNKIFEKSIEERPEDKPYVFVDGPPFVSGLPHYGHLLTSIPKDIIPRYWTMKGYRVRRVWGWDCHGLPVEAKVNKEHNIKGRDQVENEFGVDRYIEECRKYVNGNIEEWKWYIEKIGRWVDLENAYYTMKPEFNESVIWAFKQMWDKGLIYKGKRVSLYSTDTATPVSNFEVAMDPDNYRETNDLAVFIKFRLKDNPFKSQTEGKDVFMVAWTTTPWTLPSNFALAVNKDFDYSLVEFNGQFYVLATERLSYSFSTTEDNIGESPANTVRVLKTMKGSELENLEYEALYDFYKDECTENDYKVYLSDEVVNDEGSGVLHIAPAFGEVDYQFGQEKGLSAISDIDKEGNMLVGEWDGIYMRDASPLVTEDLEKKHRLLRSETYTHRLPYYRGDNPLIYMAQDSFFVDIQSMKEKLLEHNQEINWVPDHVKEGRFAKTVESAPDWAISRDRYWATIMPLWVSEDGDQLVIGSFDEMMEYTDQIEKVVVDGKNSYMLDGVTMSLHRDFCDKIILVKDGKEYHRVPQVLDVWMDSGSVPFAEYGYPFTNQEEFENGAPADFIVEYVGQVRAWFNVLHRLSVILFDRPAFKNVICHGVLAGNDGRKMSKTYGNYPDPRDVLENIGGEALRLYLMSTGIMSGGDMEWSDEDLREQVKTVMIPYWNTYRYLTLYANMHDWTPENTEFPTNNVLDRWIKSYMMKVSSEYESALQAYDLPNSVKLIQPAIDNLSTWWIRRSRERFAQGDPEALQTLYASLVHLSKTFAPQMPFLAEEIYQNLVVGVGIEDGLESVHLELYPEPAEIDEKLLEDMDKVRYAASVGQFLRESSKMKLRQPLSKAYVSVDDKELLELLQSELNVKVVEFSKEVQEADGIVTKEENGVLVSLDTNLSPELIKEGLFNELVRNMQVLRKKSGCEVGEKVIFSYHTESEELKQVLAEQLDEIAEKVDAKEISENNELEVKAQIVNGHELQLEVVR
jgi:isoleucyl-tRNA synthetase